MKQLNWKELLGAMSGCAYLVASDGEILAVGGSGWARSANDNGGDELSPGKLIGRNLFSCISGDSVREFYTGLHATLGAGSPTNTSFELRCDAPDTERRMLMSVTMVPRAVGEPLFLYQSQILEQRVRVPIPLFGNGNSKSYRDEDLVSICSFCSKIAWPIGADQQEREWISPDTYYQRGGPMDAVLSHGICPTCFSEKQAGWRKGAD